MKWVLFTKKATWLLLLCNQLQLHNGVKYFLKSFITPSPPLRGFLPMKAKVKEFCVSWIISTVPLTQFLCNAVFSRNQNVRNAGNRCISFKCCGGVQMREPRPNSSYVIVSIKCGYSEKFEKNHPLKIWHYSVTSNFKWKIFSNFGAFSEYPNCTL